MMEYQKHLDFYAENYWFSTSSTFVSSNQWGDKELAKQYLQNYWLSEQEYLDIWKFTQNNLFVQDKKLPDLIHNNGLEIIALRGGNLFLKEDFLQLQKAMIEIGDEYFIVIQNSQEFMDGEPMFRMKFPVNITWEELTSGNYISAVLLEMSYNEYFVFGSTGKWGKYSANDYEYPLDIICFMPELSYIFQKHFQQPKEEQEEIKEWLPKEYKKLVKNKL